MVPVLMVAAAECLRVAGGAATEVYAWYVVNDRTDVRELNILLSDTFTSTTTSCLQLSLLRCSVYTSTHAYCFSCLTRNRKVLRSSPEKSEQIKLDPYYQGKM